MRKLQYLEQLKPLYHVSFFTIQDAQQQGVPRHALAYLEKKGHLQRIYPGTYRFLSYESDVEFQWEQLALVAASIPYGIICLISALVWYELTDQIMREIWIAVPHHLYAPKRPNTRVIRMRNTTLGAYKMILGGHSVQIFDQERCIIDAFRYLSKEIAIKALQKYLYSKEVKPDLKKLGSYAKKLRVNITPYILSYTT